MVYVYSKKYPSKFLVEQRVKSNKQRAKRNDQRAKSNEQRVKSNEQRATSKKYSLFCLLRSGFQRAIYDASKFFLVLAFFGAFEMKTQVKAMVDVALKDFLWFWNTEYICFFDFGKFGV